MSVISDFELFRDKYGFNQLDPGQTSQNGTLFTVEYLFCLLSHSNIPEEYKLSEIRRIKELFKTVEPFPGISCRYPNNNEFDSMDNTIALYVFSGLFDNGKFSKRAYYHGLTTRAKGLDTTQGYELTKKYYWIAKLLSGGQEPNFFWNNNTPELFCFFGWHGRSPAHMALLRWTADINISILEKFYLLIGQFIGLFTEHMDGLKLPYVGWQFLRTKGFFWRLAYKLWGKLLLRRFSKGMIEVYGNYYRKDHPIVVYSKELI